MNIRATLDALRLHLTFRNLLIHLGLFIAFLAVSRLSFVFQTTELRATPWNPETGIAVAAGFILRWPAVVTLSLAILVSTRLGGWPLPGVWEHFSAISRAAIFTGAAAAAAPVVLRSSVPSLPSLLLFFAFSAAVTAAYAIIRIGTLWLSVGIEPKYLLPFTVTLSIGNLVGILTVVPLFMPTEKSSRITSYLSGWSAFHWLAFGGLVIISFIVFGIRGVDQFKFFYLVFLPVIAFTVRDGFTAAAFSVFVSDLLMIAILYWRDFESSTMVELQFLMLSLSITGLLLGTAISDRSRAVKDLKESHVRLQESQLALLQASRLSLASEMAAALAHELNQPLSSVRNFVRAVRRKLDSRRIDRNALISDIDAAVGQVDAAASLLRSTRNFLERGTVHRAPHDIQSIIANCTALVQPELQRARITLVTSGAGALPPVLCNEVQIQQVLLNVIKNAREAIVAHGSAKRVIEVTASRSTRPGFVEVSIADTGPGVPPELKSLLFLPLQSTKPEGLGLGLSLCSTIIRSHGGDFWLDGSALVGARFVFTLPCPEPEDTRSLPS
ncbi:ATP-binding protein [Aestuariivirga sp.]|uniref:ATP-binding protein n=1 Tax=Aestuariivirga sp. TaxID=2650926 RepID=UPI00391C2BF7